MDEVKMKTKCSKWKQATAEQKQMFTVTKKCVSSVNTFLPCSCEQQLTMKFLQLITIFKIHHLTALVATHSFKIQHSLVWSPYRAHVPKLEQCLCCRKENKNVIRQPLTPGFKLRWQFP